MKKMLVLVFVLALALSLTACGSKEVGNVQEISVPSEQEFFAQICWENNGTLAGPDNCVLPKEEVECTEAEVIYLPAEEETVGEQNVSSDCLFEAGSLGLPKDIANYVCDGVRGEVSDQLKTCVFVPFGTFTMDAEWRVWVLYDFTVPHVANYSFDYTDAERNLLQAPFLIGSESGWQGEERVPFTVCYDFEGECSLGEGIISQLFPTN